MLDAVCRLVGQLPPLNAPTRELLAGLADGAAARWTDPDHERWDDRDAPQHYLYSKLMSWVALDRAISLASRLGHSARVAVWTIANAQIRAAILDRGWSPLLGAYAQAFDSATIDRVAAGLAAPCGLIYRFEHAPNTPRLEPTLLLCSYWLVQCLALAGRPGRPARSSSGPRRTPTMSACSARRPTP